MDCSDSEDNEEKKADRRPRIEGGDMKEGNDGVKVNEVEPKKRVCDGGRRGGRESERARSARKWPKRAGEGRKSERQS